MPAATAASGRAKRRASDCSLPGTRIGRPRYALGRVRRLQREPREHDRVLFEVLFPHPLVRIDVCVVRAHVVGGVVLHGIEAWDAGGLEAEMIGVANPGEHVASRATILEGREPCIEPRLYVSAILEVPPVDRSPLSDAPVPVCHESR